MSIPDERFNLAWYKTEVEKLEAENESLRMVNQALENDVINATGNLEHVEAEFTAFCALVEAGKPVHFPKGGEALFNKLPDDMKRHYVKALRAACNAHGDDPGLPGPQGEPGMHLTPEVGGDQLVVVEGQQDAGASGEGSKREKEIERIRRRFFEMCGQPLVHEPVAFTFGNDQDAGASGEGSKHNVGI